MSSPRSDVDLYDADCASNSFLVVQNSKIHDDSDVNAFNEANVGGDSDGAGSLNVSYSSSSASSSSSSSSSSSASFSDSSSNDSSDDEEQVRVIIDPVNMSAEDSQILEMVLEDYDEISTTDISKIKMADNKIHVSLKYDIFPFDKLPTGEKRLEVLEKMVESGSHTEYQLHGYIEIAKDGGIKFKSCPNQKIIRTTTINLFAMSPDTNKFFAKFCQDYLRDEIGEIFIYGGFHRYTISEIRYDLTVSHSLFSRRSKRNESDRFEILPCNKIINEGAFGSVFPSEGTLKFAYDKSLIFSTEKKRVIKEEVATKFKSGPIKLLMKVDYLGYKMPTVVQLADKKCHRFSVMRYMEGELFFNSIARLREQNFSVEDRCHYSLRAIKSLQIIQDHKIVHRDFKPENLIYNEKNGVVRAIDLDGSKFCDEQDGIFYFTYAYAAPEIYEGSVQTSFKSDITSLGITISLIWGAKSFDALQESQNPDKAKALFEKYSFQKLKLFKHVHGISKSERHRISDILQQMVSVKPEDRPELEVIREVFEIILLDKLIVKMCDISKTDVSSEYTGIYKKMVAARLELREIQKTTTTISPQAAALLQAKLFSIIGIIPNNEMAIPFFVGMLDIHAFNGLTNIESVITKVEGVSSLFDVCYRDSLEDFQHRAEAALKTAQDINASENVRAAKNLQKLIKKAFKRCGEYMFNFDNVQLLTGKLQKEVDQIEPSLIHCETVLAGLAQQYKVRTALGLFGGSQKDRDNHPDDQALVLFSQSTNGVT